jgi:hypothetical protein
MNIAQIIYNYAFMKSEYSYYQIEEELFPEGQRANR